MAIEYFSDDELDEVLTVNGHRLDDDFKEVLEWLVDK